MSMHLHFHEPASENADSCEMAPYFKMSSILNCLLHPSLNRTRFNMCAWCSVKCKVLNMGRYFTLCIWGVSA